MTKKKKKKGGGWLCVFFFFSVQRYEDFTIYNKVKQDYFASVMFQ